MKWFAFLFVCLVSVLGMNCVEASPGSVRLSRPVRQTNTFSRPSIYFQPGVSTGQIGIARPSQVGVARPSSIGVASPNGK